MALVYYMRRDFPVFFYLRRLYMMQFSTYFPSLLGITTSILFLLYLFFQLKKNISCKRTPTMLSGATSRIPVIWSTNSKVWNFFQQICRDLRNFIFAVWNKRARSKYLKCISNEILTCQKEKSEVSLGTVKITTKYGRKRSLKRMISLKWGVI